MQVDQVQLTNKIASGRKTAAMSKEAIVPRLRRLMTHPNWKNMGQVAARVGTAAGDAAAIGYGMPLAYNMATGEAPDTTERLGLAAAAVPLMVNRRARGWARKNLKAPLLTASALDATQQATMGHSLLRPDQVKHTMEKERDSMIAGGIDAVSNFLDNPGNFLERGAPVVNSVSTAASRPPFWSA